MEKSIEIKNPLPKKTIQYVVAKEGHADFSFDENAKIILEPGHTEKFTITYHARISKPVKGRIMFTN